MSDITNESSTFITGVEQLEVKQEYKDKLLEIHDDLTILKETSTKYNIHTLAQAYNDINSLKDKMIDMITILEDITIQNPSTTDEELFNIRVMEYFMETVRMFNGKFGVIGSPAVTTAAKSFRIFNFNSIVFSSRTKHIIDSDEDKYKPFKNIHNIKPVKRVEYKYTPEQTSAIKASLKRIAERNKAKELLD